MNRELAARPTLAELNRVVGEQSLIMESLCAEHLLGRWIWKSGRTKGEKHLVPWNVQNINTNPGNFNWEKDKAVITCTAPVADTGTYAGDSNRTPPNSDRCFAPCAQMICSRSSTINGHARWLAWTHTIANNSRHGRTTSNSISMA